MTPRVVVIGAGVAGLFAAAACRGAGCRVVVLERDGLDGSGPRPGVPQGTQPHIYLQRGLRAAQELLPGLRDELRAAGAVPFDTAAIGWRSEFGWYPAGALSFDVLSMTRPRFESVLRRMVLELGGVEVRTGQRVTGLTRGPGSCWRIECVDAAPVEADLVVDASGRSTRLPIWLEHLGCTPPAVEQIDARVGYATRRYADTPDLGALSGILVQATPGRPVGAAAIPVEDGGWLVGLIGYGEHRPPRDEAAFVGFTAQLVDPCVADFVAAARPCGPVQIHRQTANRHHHFERIRDWPAGLLPIGDAFVCFNPIYGQGVTVAALQAVLLRDAVRTAHGVPDTRSLLRRFAATARLPWRIATAQDLRYPTGTGRRSPLSTVAGRWVLTVQKLAVHGDLRAFAAVNRLYHLLASPAVVAHPALLAAAIRGRVRGFPPAVPRPVDLPRAVGRP